ncbi:MAG: hypothetical protein AAF846_29655, partial [Chloroflexota bacterium]
SRKQITLILIILLSVAIGFWLYVTSPTHIINLFMYPNSQLLSKYTAGQGGNTAQSNLIYWISDDTDTVRQYFEDISVNLYSSNDDYGDWLIGQLGNNDTNSYNSAADTDSYIIHSVLCEESEATKCVTVALLDANQPQFWQTAIISPSSFRYIEKPVELLPSGGTLIIYSYRHTDF